MFKTRKRIKNENGFTLVELMVTVFLTVIAVVAIYRGYTAFSHSADAQQQVMEMQQNLRIGMSWLEKDLRRAGMNEETDENAGFTEDFKDLLPFPGSEKALSFTMDLTGGKTDGFDNDNDGDVDDAEESIYGDGDMDDDGERIRYSLGNNGLLDQWLQREVWGSGAYSAPQTIITNVEALDFVYLDEDEGEIVPGAGGLTANQLAEIRAVYITLLVRATNEDYRYTNDVAYENNSPFGSDVIFMQKNDNFRRRSFSKLIKIRNAGL